MYFFNLKAFHPTTGINTDNHSKYPFLSSTDGLFEPDDYEFNLHRKFPFERIELVDGEPFFVSEPNLLKVFKNRISADNKIRIENTRPIDEAYTSEIAALFYKGYSAGMANFYQEIGQTFLSLELEQKKQVLRDFMSYCQINLYFEGFAIPEVLYALGYIQASLVKAFQEYSNLKGLNEKQPVKPVVKVYPVIKLPAPEVAQPLEPEVKAASIAEIPPAPEPELVSEPTPEPEPAEPELAPVAVNPQNLIPLRYPAAQIVELWCTLLDTQLCEKMQVPQVFFTEQDIKTLLGRLFAIDGQEQLWPVSAEPFYYDMAQGYQNMLCLLMHATYKLNTTYLKVPQVRYCELLKLNFSPFDTIESVGDIKSNMTKKKDTAIDFVHKSSGSYAKKAYNILKKVPTYILK